MDTVQKRYTSAENLAKDSTVVVRGALGQVTERRVDNGGLAGSSGIPMAFYSFKVAQRGKAEPTLPTTIKVGWIDTEKVGAEDARPIKPGQEYVLFLDELTVQEAPGVSDLAPFYVPVGGNAGVFEITNGTAVATDPEVVGLRARDTTGARRLRAAPGDLLAIASRF